MREEERGVEEKEREEEKKEKRGKRYIVDLSGEQRS